jgi:hypothetical protein
MEGFSFVTPVTGLNRPNTGKDDDDDDILYKYSEINLSLKCFGPRGKKRVGNLRTYIALYFCS